MKFSEFLRLYESEEILNKLRSAGEIVISIISKRTGTEWLPIRDPEEFQRDGVSLTGIHYFNDKNFSSIRLNTNVAQPGIIHSLDFWVNGGSLDSPDYTFTFGAIPITNLLNDIAELISNPSNLQRVVNESILYEGRIRGELDEQTVQEIKKLLAQKMSAKEISIQLGIPYGRILSISNGQTAKVQPSPRLQENEKTLEDKVKMTEAILEDIQDLSAAVGEGKFKSLFISGRAGTGKTYNVEQGLLRAGLRPDIDFFYVSGTISTFEMYKKLYQYSDKVLVFDDADSVFNDQESRNILKAALDSKKVRIISYLKKIKQLYDVVEYEKNPDMNIEGLIPNRFEFTGSVIFVSNLPKEKADPDGAIRTRSILIDVNPDDMTLLEMIKKMLPYLEPKNLSMQQKLEIFEFVKTSKNVSMRTFLKAASFYEAGLKNWKRMAEMYI